MRRAAPPADTVAPNVHASGVAWVVRQQVGVQADGALSDAVGQLDLDAVADVHVQHQRLDGALARDDAVAILGQHIHLARVAQDRQRRIDRVDGKGLAGASGGHTPRAATDGAVRPGSDSRPAPGERTRRMPQLPSRSFENRLL